MGVTMLAQFHHDPTPPHFMGYCTGSAGTGKGIEDEVIGFRSQGEDAMN